MTTIDEAYAAYCAALEAHRDAKGACTRACDDYAMKRSELLRRRYCAEIDQGAPSAVLSAHIDLDMRDDLLYCQEMRLAVDAAECASMVASATWQQLLADEPRKLLLGFGAVAP